MKLDTNYRHRGSAFRPLRGEAFISSRKAIPTGADFVNDVLEKYGRNGFIVVSAYRASWTDEKESERYGHSETLAREVKNTGAVQVSDDMDDLVILEGYLKLNKRDDLAQRISKKFAQDVRLNESIRGN